MLTVALKPLIGGCYNLSGVYRKERVSLLSLFFVLVTVIDCNKPGCVYLVCREIPLVTPFGYKAEPTVVNAAHKHFSQGVEKRECNNSLFFFVFF